MNVVTLAQMFQRVRQSGYHINKQTHKHAQVNTCEKKETHREDKKIEDALLLSKKQANTHTNKHVQKNVQRN